MLTLQQLLIVSLPVLIPALASMLAAALAQDGFDKFAPWLNPLLAYFFLIAAAVGTAYAEGQLTADTTGLVTVVTFIFSLAVSGGLHALTPWLKWLSLIQTYFFAIVRATAKGTPAPIATKTTQESVPVQERAPLPIHSHPLPMRSHKPLWQFPHIPPLTSGNFKSPLATSPRYPSNRATQMQNTPVQL